MISSNYKKIKRAIRLSLQLISGYKLQISVLAALGFLSGLLESIGINALIPLFSFALGQAGSANDLVSRTLREAFSFFHIGYGVRHLLIFISFLFVLRALVILLFTYVTIKIISTNEEKSRSRLFQIILKANWTYLLRQRLGHLETVLMTNLRNSTQIIDHIGRVIILVSTLIVYTIFAFSISFYVTLSTLIFGAILFFILRPLSQKVRSVATESEQVVRKAAHLINENILGMKTVKTMSVGPEIAKTGKGYFMDIRRIQVKSAIYHALNPALMQPVSLIFICLVFAFSYKSSNFNFASLVAVAYLIKQIFTSIEQLQSKMLSINELFPYYKSVQAHEKEALEHEEKTGGEQEFSFKKELEFKNVSFAYNAGRTVLKDVNFKLKKGEMIGLIGTSGAGKTTIVDLILRLFDSSGGKILVDGKDVASISIDAWRKEIGYVSQDIFLKNDTIANNIRFYNNTISEEGMIQASKMANIYEFIMSCPEKFNTVLGDRGVLISAGQRQRIIIARILARKPEFLILDEATSALDNESEMQIQKIIGELKGKITVLVIAHRLSTIINSDRLLVLEEGKISEQGEPKELLKDKSSYFFKVYNIKTA